MNANPVSICGGRRLKGIKASGTAAHPLVTVVTAVFNGQLHLANCLKSVLGQDYPSIEHIVIDGGSVDGTIDVLREYDDRLALWKSEPDKGVYDAWNKALVEACGEWICFLGADDELLPGAASAYMELAARNPEAEYLSSQIRWIHPSGFERVRGGCWAWPRFSKWMCVAHVGSMHRRSLYDRIGKYDTTYRSAADYELLLRARHNLKAAFMPVITVKMRAGGMSDGSASVAETTRAKIATGGRNRLLAEIEEGFTNVKFGLRPLRRALARRSVVKAKV
jgi:glycosyltransferase involved in cell wall biosynthesis